MLDTVSTTAMDPVQEISASHMLTSHFDKCFPTWPHFIPTSQVTVPLTF